MNRRKFLEKLGIGAGASVIAPSLLLKNNELQSVKPKEILGECTTSLYKDGSFHYDIPIEGMEVTLSGGNLSEQIISVKGETIKEMKNKLRNYKLPCGNKLSSYIEIV